MKEKRFRIEKGPKGKEIPPNVVIVETPETIYRIVYGTHDTPQSPEDLGEADALILETGESRYDTPELAQRLCRWAENTIQYKDIIKKARQEKKPIYFVDISDPDVALILQIVLRLSEPIVGLTILLLLAKDIIKNPVMTRRQFLKKSIRFLSGSYFLSHLLEDIAKQAEGKKVDERSASRKISRFLTDLNERIHPETNAVILTLRNYLFAQKMETIVEELSKQIKGKKPEVAIVVGAGHHGIERALQESKEERREIIETILNVFRLKKIRMRIATIARLDFDKKENRWRVTKIFKDPILAPLEKN